MEVIQVINKKGFTLIELVMVIALLAIMALILVPNVLVLIDKNNEKSCNSLKDNIISSAKLYVSENKYQIGFDCSNIPKEVKISELLGYGNLTGDVINPVTKEDLQEEIVKITYDCDKKNFNYDFAIDCTKKK